MPTDVQILQEMGFPENRAVKALAKTNYRGAQVAMDWLLEHQDDANIDDPVEAPKGYTLGSTPTETGDGGGGEGTTSEEPMTTDGETQSSSSTDAAQASCLKCDDCGKLLKSQMDAQAHAVRTKHSNFSESTQEIKPLTEEEKKAQLQQVQDRLAQRRKEKEQEDKKAKFEREKIRRKQGQEMVAAKQQMAEKEMKLLAEAKRREKEDARLAKQKVRDDIAKDKAERAARAAKPASSAASAVAEPAPVPVAPVEKKNYDDCRLQIRLTNGQALTQTFKAREQLAAVRLYVQLNRTDGESPISLMTSFPKKVFGEDDMEKPLTELGLVPSAVLIATKK